MRKKRLEVTSEILSNIEAATGTSVEASDIVVFEAAAASTRKITKPGSVYDGAIMSRELLVEMAQGVNNGTHSVPLHTLHQQGDELPVGRVFHGEVLDEVDGTSTLVTQFYLPASASDLVEKIELAVLDEVSVGVKSTKAQCSKCGFDYFGEDATFMNFFEQTCPDGHVIGEEGTHLRLTGLDRFLELSLVSRGASDKPKILSRARAQFDTETVDRLAASGTPLEAYVLLAESNMETDPAMDIEAKLAELTGKLDRSAELETELAASTTKVEGLEAELATKTDEAAELTTKLAAAEAEVETLKAAAAIRAPESIPAGGLSASALADAGTTKTDPRSAAFKTR